MPRCKRPLRVAGVRAGGGFEPVEVAATPAVVVAAALLVQQPVHQTCRNAIARGSLVVRKSRQGQNGCDSLQAASAA